MWGKKPVTAILFDVGGVLIHYRQESFFQLGAMLYGCTPEALSSCAAPLVPKLERGEFRSREFWGELGVALQSRGLGRIQSPDKFKGLWVNLLKDSLRMDPSMLSLCRRLQAKMPVGALSNTIDEHARYLEAYGAYDAFNPCVLSCDVGVRKPERAIYHMAADLLNTDPRNCLFIDDSAENVAGAKAAKMQAHLFTDQATLEAELRNLKLL